MAKHDVVVGLDVGTTKVSCIIGEVDPDNKIDIVGKGKSYSCGVKKGVVVNIDETVKSITKAVEEAERMAGYKVNSVYVGVTGEHISSINSHGVITVANGNKEIITDDVKRAVEAAKIISIPSEREVIHVIPGDFTIDGQSGVKNPVGMSGSRLEVDTHIVTGVVTFLNNVNKCVVSAGLEVEDNGLVLEPLASSLAVLQEAEKELGTLLIDIGGGTTDLAIFRQGNIWHTAALPIGGNHITYDIAVAFRLSLDEAELVKISHGYASPSIIEDEETIQVTPLSKTNTENITSRQLTEMIFPRVEEIFSLIKAEINRVLTKDMTLAAVTITGGTSLLKGIEKVAEEVLELPVRVGCPAKINGMADTVASPIYSTGVGLLLYGAKMRQELKAMGRRECLWNRGILGKFQNWWKEFF